MNNLLEHTILKSESNEIKNSYYWKHKIEIDKKATERYKAKKAGRFISQRKKKEIYKRTCPKCFNIILYEHKNTYLSGIKFNKECKDCRIKKCNQCNIKLKNNIKLLRIPYTDINKINEILNKELKGI